MGTDSEGFEPDQELIAKALAEVEAIEHEGRFTTSEEARQKQDTPFADEVVELNEDPHSGDGSTDTTERGNGSDPPPSGP